MKQRCTVCGRDVRFHRPAEYRLRQDGKEIRRATASRCALVQQWQGLLLDGSMMGRRMTITKVQPPAGRQTVTHSPADKAKESIKPCTTESTGTS